MPIFAFMKGFMRTICTIGVLLCTIIASAQNDIEYSAGIIANTSTGDFAPYFIGSLNNGRMVRSSTILTDLTAKIEMDRTKQFSWGGGVEFITGYSSANKYSRWNESTRQWGISSNRPSALWVQQLYGELKYRGVFMCMGQKDHTSSLLDESISSGDLTRSSNARGIPGVEVGFVDFQNIPFTDGWIQIDGVVEYGRFTDNNFNRQQFNYYNFVVTSNINYTYKRCYFRTNPSQPFSITVGMQTAGQFGGSWRRYINGKLTRENNRGFKLKDVWNMFFPTRGGTEDGYYEGNSLGTWDFKARYMLKSGAELTFAFQWPWEDGSGIAHRNGWDGLWGLYYQSPRRSIVTGAAIEYLDFRNHSGPIHWAPNDNPGTTITTEATGGDDYYNNEGYGSYRNYGMAIATPFLVAPIYNLDGFSGFEHNRARGIHAAVRGCIGSNLDYSVKYSWQQAWGRGRVHQAMSMIDNSMLISATWNAKNILQGLKLDAKAAFDAGRLRGNNFGIFIGVTYSGNLTFKYTKI